MYRLKKPSLIAGALVCLFAITVILCGSCSSVKPVVPTVVDSITTSVNTIERDTTVTAPAASTGFSVPVAEVFKAIVQGQATARTDGTKVDKPAPVPLGHSNSKQASASAVIEDGALKIDCQCDSMGIATKLFDKVLKTNHVRTITLPPKEVKYVPMPYKILSGIGLVAVIIIVVVVYRGIKRKITG